LHAGKFGTALRAGGQMALDFCCFFGVAVIMKYDLFFA
jgi:hypothetical protein